MNRARLISTLLGLILLACAAVIYLDQRGTFGNTSAGTPPPASTEITPTSPTNTTTPVPAQPTDSSGYGGLK